MNKKGQVFSIDFLTSIAPFFFILSLTIMIWYNTNYKIEQRERNLEIQNKILSLSDAIVKTKGNPENWEEKILPNETDKIISLGLSSRDNVIDAGKFLRLIEFDYIKTKKIFGIPRFQLFLGLYDKNGQIIKSNGKDMAFGIFPPEKKDRYSITRMVVFEDNDVRVLANLRVIIWL